jgi:hypothetical protein
MDKLELAMPLSPEQRRDRARLAATRRHHGPNAPVPDGAAELERAATDRQITDLIARVPTQVTWRLAPEDRAALDRLLRLLFGAAGGGADGT